MARSRGRNVRIGIVLTALVLVGAACGSDTDSADQGGTGPSNTSEPKELTKIQFRLSWTAGSDMLPWVAAQQEGFFEEEGLDVAILEAGDATSTIKLVASGENEMGYTYAPDLLLAAQQGLDIVSFYAYFQTAPFGLIAKKKSGIETASDLRGKKVGVTAIPIDQVSFDTMLESAGLTRDDVTVVDVGFSGEQALLADRVDATSALTFSEGVHLSEAGVPYNFLYYYDYGVPDYPFEVMIVNGEFLDQNPELVRGFAAATSKGIEFAMANPEEAVQDLIDAYPEIKYDFAFTEWTDGYSNMFTSDLTDQYGLGYQDPQTWEATSSYFRDVGLLKEPIDLASLYTNDYLPSTQ